MKKILSKIAITTLLLITVFTVYKMVETLNCNKETYKLLRGEIQHAECSCNNL